jgi:hypothetical protein
LESYWYKFLRINKFNVGENPIETFNRRIFDLVKNTNRDGNFVINQIHETINGLQNWEIKECPKCKEVRDLNDFRDDLLRSKYWRFCKYCKGPSHKAKTTIGKEGKEVTLINGINCPKCWSKMVLRNWRHWKFYGCSKFPYCRWTRQY